MDITKKIKLLDKELANLPPIDLKTEIKLRAITNFIIDRVIEDRANGYYIDKKGVRQKRRTSGK